MSALALVTGANRGIGLEVCRQLAQRDFTVILGSRDLAKGQQAAAPFLDQGLSLDVQQLRGFPWMFSSLMSPIARALTA